MEHAHVIEYWNVWTITTLVVYALIGVDATRVAWKLPWGSVKSLFLLFASIFWLSALTGYAPFVFPNWPMWLVDITHRTLPVVSLLFLLGGGFNLIMVNLMATKPPLCPPDCEKHERELECSKTSKSPSSSKGA